MGYMGNWIEIFSEKKSKASEKVDDLIPLIEDNFGRTTSKFMT